MRWNRNGCARVNAEKHSRGGTGNANSQDRVRSRTMLRILFDVLFAVAVVRDEVMVPEKR